VLDKEGWTSISELLIALSSYIFDRVAIKDKVTACVMKKVPFADEALD